MASGILIIVVGLVGALVAVTGLYLTIAKRRMGVRGGLNKIKAELTQRQELKFKFEELYDSMVDIGSLRKIVDELKVLQEALKAERGRITITRAELETVETRLRELEEIERELEASGIETKQELEILKKKEAELASKNNSLKDQLSASMAQMDELLKEITITAEMQAHIDFMKAEIIQTEQKVDILLLQIEGGNEQYFTLKKRYDALDIEYAQLYEKFSESEPAPKEN